jgi:regulatory protein
MGFSRRKLETEDQLYDYAIAALARRMRSIAELKRMLRQRVDAQTEIGKTLLEVVIRRLKDQGYLNDQHYATAYSAFRRDNEKFGRRRVVTDLKAKGVQEEIIDRALESTFSLLDEEKQARQYLQRKRIEKPRNQQQLGRVFRQLLRAGFSSKTIFAILRKWNVDEESLDQLETE